MSISCCKVTTFFPILQGVENAITGIVKIVKMNENKGKAPGLAAQGSHKVLLLMNDSGQAKSSTHCISLEISFILFSMSCRRSGFGLREPLAYCLIVVELIPLLSATPSMFRYEK